MIYNERNESVDVRRGGGEAGLAFLKNLITR
jgi:hypothetical protein